MASRITVYVDKDGKIAYIDENVKASEDGETVAKKLAELEFEKKK
jgi:peroxiredoxin